MNDKKTKATFNLDAELLQEFRVESVKNGKKMSNILEGFIREYVKRSKENGN